MITLTNISLIEQFNGYVTQVAGVDVLVKGLHIVADGVDYYVNEGYTVTKKGGKYFIKDHCSCYVFELSDTPYTESVLDGVMMNNWNHWNHWIILTDYPIDAGNNEYDWESAIIDAYGEGKPLYVPKLQNGYNRGNVLDIPLSGISILSDGAEINFMIEVNGNDVVLKGLHLDNNPINVYGGRVSIIGCKNSGGSDGFTFAGGADWGLVSGCYVESDNNGVYLVSDHNRIVDNHIVCLSAEGVYLDGSYNVISGNVIQANTPIADSGANNIHANLNVLYI